ncbi:LacI family transcriptional regulator [bacterium]|nr:MAG: LacI family transcriptional regulator [bacterium]
MSTSTIYDIAKAANVSIATVSRVFNNSNSVSPKTKKKIMEIAGTMGYHPKAYAQGLARRNSKMLMILVPVISNYFFMEVLAGIQDKLLEYDYDLNIHNLNSGNSSDINDQVDYVVKRGLADGYILVSVHQQEAYWEQLKSYQIPLVLIDEYHPDFDSVSVDSVEGSYSATKHLIDQGYRKIALISANPSSKPMKDRRSGYKRALEDNGVVVDDKLIIVDTNDYRDGFTEENGYNSMLKILKKHPEVDAVVCASDIQALGAIKAMQDEAKRLPIIGFDDLPISKFLGLSTMKQPMYEMGTLALEKLIQRIKRKDNLISHTVFSPELIKRESSVADSVTV